MLTTINLNDLEKKVFSTTHKDGLLDIFLSIILLQFVIGPFLTDIGFSDFAAAAAFIPVWLIAYIIFLLIKKYVTKPRIGKIKPGPARKAKLMKVNIIALLILFAGFLIGLMYSEYSSTINHIFPITFSILILSVSFVAAYFFDINRLYYYGIMIAIGPIIGEILWQNGLVSHHGFPLVFGISSIILCITGMTLFVRFLKTYPLVKMEK